MAEASVATILLEWYRANRRDLPWRHTTDPYPIWVSEIMLQQTQVKTVLPYYARFLIRFPTAESLASASEDEMLEAWQGLGYYRRARNLQTAARLVVEQGWPTNYLDWRGLPGVGDYTAAALASIVLGERKAVVDGNVERVYARSIGDFASGSALKERARKWAQGLIENGSDHPGDFNQAMMEIGATVCTPRNPTCSVCPLAQNCFALTNGAEGDLPKASVKPTIVKLKRFGLAYLADRSIALQRIPDGEWWAGMWTMPWRTELPELEYRHLGVIKHTVTHHRIDFHVLAVDDLPQGATMFELADLPALPSLQRKAIELIQR